jgi:hypothetical protein
MLVVVVEGGGVRKFREGCKEGIGMWEEGVWVVELVWEGF